jgi:hypothetical protein
VALSRRRLPTVLAVGLVAAVGAAALVDSFHDSSVQPAVATDAPDPGGGPVGRQAGALRAAGATGLLVVSRPDCRVETVTVPDLDRAPVDACTSVLTESGRMVSFDGRLASPADNRRTASCEGGAVAVQGGGAPYELRGCRPVWRPDGALTLLRAGALHGFRLPDGDRRILLSRRDLGRMLADVLDPAVRRSLALAEVAWVTDTRLLAIVRSEGTRPYALAELEGKRLSGWFCCYEDLRDLRLSARGTYAAVRAEGGFLARGPGGGLTPILPSRPVYAVAWSPDERFLAVATPSAIEVLDAARPGAASVARIPVAAGDLRWVVSSRQLLRPPGRN